MLFPGPQPSFGFRIWAPFLHLSRKSVPPTCVVLLPAADSSQPWVERGRGCPVHYSRFPRPWQSLPPPPPPPLQALPVPEDRKCVCLERQEVSQVIVPTVSGPETGRERSVLAAPGTFRSLLLFPALRGS